MKTKSSQRTEAAAAILAGALALAHPSAAAASADPSAPFARLLESFVAAERDFDQARLAALITTDYVEISPIGEVDGRERMLGFYAPAKKRPGPAIAIDDVAARVTGNAATVTARLSYAVATPTGEARSVALRGGFLIRRVHGDWKIAFAQYTPVRSAKP